MFRKSVSFRIITNSLLSAYILIPLLQGNTISVNAQTPHASASCVEAKAECVMELHTRRILYESNGDIRLPMASTTKIATAATVLRLCEDIGAEFSIPQEAVGIEGSSVYLQQGEIYSVEDLLYGLMLRSGNDCATALSLYCSGSIENFSRHMNETAQRAGALNTSFKNPHGLPCKEHFTTARDLSYISCYAMQNPTFRKIVSTEYYEPRHWKNKNKMLTTYKGGIGIKTGYTKEAGRCLVSAAKRDGMTLVCTVLNCPTTYERSAQLLDDAFSAYHYTKLLSKDEVFTVGEGKNAKKCRALQDFYYPLMKGEENSIEINVKENYDGEIIGQIEILLAKRLLFSGNLYKL